MLPPTFISDVRSRIGFLDHVIYACDKCTAKASSVMIQRIEMESHQKWRKLQVDQCRDICEMKKILEEQRMLFHEGHANVFDVKVELAVLIGAQSNLKLISNELLPEKIQYCNETAVTYKLIMPCEFLLYLF